MADATQRSYKAGEAMAKAIIEMVHLMYQNKTASHFYRGLHEVLIIRMVELERERQQFIQNKDNNHENPNV